jgi:RNase P protein component
LERDWSIKPLIREIVQSQTYRQSSVVVAAQKTNDPENRWLSHQNRRRIDAECLLDAILTASDRRVDELGGSEIASNIADDYGYTHRSNRRAAYWPVFRNALPEVFEAFDFADPSLPTGSRTVSTVAPQSLFFLNNQWVTTQARYVAQRILNEPFSDDAARADRVFRIVLGRAPKRNEIRIVMDAMRDKKNLEDEWALIIQALFASIDFRYVE